MYNTLIKDLQNLHNEISSGVKIRKHIRVSNEQNFQTGIIYITNFVENLCGSIIKTLEKKNKWNEN